MTKRKTELDEELKTGEADSEERAPDAVEEDLLPEEHPGDAQNDPEPLASEEGEADLTEADTQEVDPFNPPNLESPTSVVLPISHTSTLRSFGGFTIDFTDPKHVKVIGEMVNSDLGETTYEAVCVWLISSGHVK